MHSGLGSVLSTSQPDHVLGGPPQLSNNHMADVHNNLKNRRIEIFFRNRYISIGNNVSMKNKINQLMSKQ